MAGQPAGQPAGTRWRHSALLATLVMVVGLLGSWGLAVAVDNREQSYASAAMDERVQVLESAVTAEVRRYVETSADLAVAIGSQNDLSAADFAALTSNLNRWRLPGISEVSLVVPATTEEISQTQRDWRARGSRQLTLVPARTTGVDHLFVVLTRTLDGTRARTGRDLSQVRAPSQAMAAARSGGDVAASPTYVVKDQGLPASLQQQSLVLAAPISGGAGTAREGQFLGWLMMGIRGRDFTSETMRMASQDTVTVTLSDDSTLAPAAMPIAQVTHGGVLGGTGLIRRVPIEVAGRTWRLQVQPTTQFMASLGPPLTIQAGGTGVVFTLLLALLVGTLSRSRNRALAKVDLATAALRADIERRELVEAALREREEELRVLALTDSLTGLANRRAFMDKLDQSHARALRSNSPVCVLFCDVDHFKTINDTYGHAAGDAVLCGVAARLLQHFRTEDTVGRLGGDEFAIICEGSSAFTEVLLDRLRDVLAVPYTIDGNLIAATVSVGMATPTDGETSAQLLERADSTMYLAKAARSAPPADLPASRT